MQFKIVGLFPWPLHKLQQFWMKLIHHFRWWGDLAISTSFQSSAKHVRQNNSAAGPTHRQFKTTKRCSMMDNFHLQTANSVNFLCVWFASLLLTNRQEKSKPLKKKPTFNTHKWQRKKKLIWIVWIVLLSTCGIHFLFLFFAGDTIFQCKRPGLTKRWTTVLLQIAKRRSEKQEFYHPRLWKYVFSVLTNLTNEYSLKHVSCLNSLWNTDKQVIILESRWPFSKINWNCTWNTFKVTVKVMMILKYTGIVT